jgi:serine protease
MSHRRWSLAALALAPLLTLGACDQIGNILRGGHAGSGPTPLSAVPLAARALSGSIQPQDQIAALLAPEPLMIAPGEILVGPRVGSELAETASEMGLGNNVIRALRATGEQALAQLPDDVEQQVRARAESEASTQARASARDVLSRLGVQGEIEVRPGGIVTVDLAHAVSPTSTAYAQQVQAQPLPTAIEWNDADRCPRIVTQGQLEDDIALATRCAIQRLQASGAFEYVEPNYIAEPGFDRLPRRPQDQQSAQAQGVSGRIGGAPNDPLYALQWDFRAPGAGEGQSPGGAGFVSFWEAAQVGSRGVRVAVLDTGLDLTHPEINASSNIAAGADMIADAARGGDGDGIDANAQDSGDKCGAATDASYHGTHVAGTIGAANTNDRVGVASGAWNVTIVPVRVLGRCGGQLADIVSAIRWAAGLAPVITAQGLQLNNATPADIINMSLTIQAPCPASMQAAIDAAVARNVVIVVAAGNKANQAALFSPANCNNVIVVGAGDARGGLAFYSDFGPQLDLIAPGGDVFSDSDGDGRPDGILSTRTTTSGCYDPVNQNSTDKCYYSFLQGTSMAAPHVSAALALLAAQTGLRGRALENALFTRAVTPFPARFAQIECARAQNATPISAGSTTCARPAGRGRLDLTRAAQTIAPVSP